MILEKETFPKSISIASEKEFSMSKFSIFVFEETMLIASSLCEFLIFKFNISNSDEIIFIPPCKILSSICGLLNYRL